MSHARFEGYLSAELRLPEDRSEASDYLEGQAFCHTCGVPAVLSLIPCRPQYQ
jgi:hypothetical protein